MKSVLGKQGNGPSCKLDESVQLEMQLRRVHNLEPFKVVTYAACYSFKSLFGRDVCVLLLVQTKVVMWQFYSVSPGQLSTLGNRPDLHIFFNLQVILAKPFIEGPAHIPSCISFISSVRSSYSHPCLLLTQHQHPTFSDHTGPHHWTFTFWATTAI